MKHTIVLAASLYLLAATISEAQKSKLLCSQALRADTRTGAAAGALKPVGNETCTQIEPLHPFTHETQIPANADMASIRFARIKSVRVATEVILNEDQDYCREVSGGDPGGSEFCPEVEFAGFVPAYEVTYSYTGPPLSSDEHANKEFTFSVDFRPDELDQKQREELSEGKRVAAAEWFFLTKSRPINKRAAIDDAVSTFCPGHHVDGNWVHDDPACPDHIRFHVITEPSDFMTIRVSVDRPVLFGKLN